jgi:hypothetical protein
MKRRKFLGQLTVGALGGALATSTLARAQTPAAPATTPADAPIAPLVRTPLVLMAPRADGIEAIWAVSQVARARLEWQEINGGAGEVSSDAFGFVPQSQSVFRLRLDGLKAGQEYRVRSVTTATDSGEEVVSAWKNFRTLNPDAKTTTFVVWNDTHLNNATIQQLHEKTPAADFLIWNGDACNDWKREDIMIPGMLNPGERDITDGHPLNFIWGNHDVRGKFAFQTSDLVATPSGRPFYAYRSGPVACICLHSGEDKPDDHPTFGGRVAFDRLREEQTVWLRETIRRPEFANAPYRVVFCHIPLRWTDETLPDYANRGYDEFAIRCREAWHDELVAWKTQFIISGHTHRHAWLPANEKFPYGQLVGGGPRLTDATWMLGEADGNQLRVVVRDLNGIVKHEVTVPPIA